MSRTVAENLPWSLAWPIIYEFLKVSTQPRTPANPLSAAQALEFMHQCLESDSLSMLIPTIRHEALLRQTVSEMSVPRGGLFHDVHIAVLMREHGVPEIITADTDFYQFKFLKVTDPVHPPGM